MPRSLALRLRRLALWLAPIALLAGCAHGTATREIDPALVACASFSVITYSRLSDTEETIIQIQAHNAAYEELCGVSVTPPAGP